MKKMNYEFCAFITATFLTMMSLSLSARQADEITSNQKVEVINALKKSFTEHYIYLDKANKVNQLLDQFLDNKELENLSNKNDFAKTLTGEINKIIDDKHFRVIVPGSRSRSTQNTDEPTHVFDTHLNALTQFRKGGFKDIKMLEGNVGYVKIDGFRGEEMHQVDGLMTYLRTADAIIIDLSDNGGGGRPVNYLSSYFLPEATLIGKTYHRNKDSWRELRAESVQGDRRLNVPLFIITSDFTFSAAEAFAYNLQASGRATVVGQVSKGGAHPTSFFPLNNGVAVLMPNRRSYNPVTKSNWEAKGVMPEYVTSKENALEKSHELAKQAAEKYRSELFDTLKLQLQATVFSEQLQAKVTQTVQSILYRKHAEPFMIAGFANALNREGNQLGAKLLFNANVQIHPVSADAHFSVAEFAYQTKDYESAQTHIETAIELASNQNNGVENRRYKELREKLTEKLSEQI